MNVEKSIAVCPGSYDPITNGHLDVIRRAAELYEEVVVAVVDRSVRKEATLFGIDERMAFIEHAIGDLQGVRAEPFNTLVVEFARRVGAKTIVKGLRAISDFEYEYQMAHMNRKLDQEIDTVIMMTGERYSAISSNIVMEIAQFGGKIDDLVPPLVRDILMRKLKGAKKK